MPLELRICPRQPRQAEGPHRPAKACSASRPCEASTSPCSWREAVATVGLHRMAGLRAAPGASRSQRGKRVPVPLARRDSNRLQRQAESLRWAAQVWATPVASRRYQRAGQVRATLQSSPAPAGGGPAPGGLKVDRVRCDSLATSRARPCAARATRLPPSTWIPPDQARRGACTGRPTCVPYP
jgi:hypothetical protein